MIHSDAARQGALEEHRSIKLSTYGIFFLGTPHQGGNGVHLGELMLKVASIFVRVDDKILKHLERDSEWLQQQLGQYGPINRDFVTKFAYETYPTRIALGKTLLVSKDHYIVVKYVLIMLRWYHRLRQSFRVLQMRRQLLYWLIISTWLSSHRVRTADMKKYQDIYSY